MRSAPAARALAWVPSVEPSSTTITSTSRIPAIRRGTAATTAPIDSASFRAETTTASFSPGSGPRGRSSRPLESRPCLRAGRCVVCTQDVLDVADDVELVDDGRIDPRAAVDHVAAAVAGEQRVVARTARLGVVALAAGDHVVAATAFDDVVSV